MEAPGDPDLDEVVRRELRLLDPTVRRSRAGVDILLEPAFREFGASGTVWDRRSMLDLLADDGAAPPRVEDIVATRLAAEVILLTYRTRRPGRRTLRSSIWRRGEHGWLLHFHQGTVSE